MTSTLGIIGLGQMAQALLLPLIEAKKIAPENIFAVVKNTASVKRLKSELPNGLNLVTADDSNAFKAWQSAIVLLSVKPQQFSEVIDQAKQIVFPKEFSSLLVSLVAGQSLSKLQESFPHHFSTRAVPNAPAFVRAGLTGISWSKTIKAEQKSLVKDLFNPVSEVLELPESQLDAFLALTSSGPAYVALVSEALADGAVSVGLPRHLANHLAHRTIAGTAALLNEKDMHPGQLKDMVASPAGTTIAALRKLEKSALRSALIEAVVAAFERSQELSDLSRQGGNSK